LFDTKSPPSCAGVCDDHGTRVCPQGLLPGGATLQRGADERSRASRASLYRYRLGEPKGWGARPRPGSFRWRLPLRWYLISLLAPLLIFLIAVTILYGLAPLRALAQNWLLLFTAFLPALAIMILLNNVAEEIGWTAFILARFQDRFNPLRAALVTTVSSGCSTFRASSRHAIMGDHGAGVGLFLLPQLSSRLIAGWLYNGAAPAN
jgi:membrane protease YdiL (CAAX protease family)